jgi:2-dehydro-3-deoxyphosphogluconate aldolase/(4S)-4-hydroxy-2-oxoglutarate aldolase
MNKEDVLTRIRSTGVVAVVRAETGDEAARIADACLAGGLQAIEVTFTVQGALGVMRDLRRRYRDDEILLGAGTVLDPETARAALLEGANYIVAPSLNLETVRLCHRYRVACMPGAMTVREVIDVMESGADVVKVFPGESLGPTFIKAVRGPLPQACLMPTGGVSLDNVGDWIRAGAIAVGVGGQLTAPAKTGNFEAVTRDAKRFIDAVREARNK